MIVCVSFGAGAAFSGGFKFFRQDVAERGDFRIGGFEVGSGMNVSDGAAADDSDSDLAHK